MTWVRYDDNAAMHPKVRDLDDATYRLWREAIEWSSHAQTDGVIRRDDLALTSRRASPARAAKLVAARLWHKPGDHCGHEKCPPSGPDGWVIHDYWDYNPTAEQVRKEQEAARERKRKWLERRKNGGGNAVPDSVPNGVPNVGKNGNPAPPRPAPKGRGGYATSAGPPPLADGAAAGGEAEELAIVTTLPDDGLDLVDERAIEARIAADREAQQRAAAQHQATTERGVAAARAALRRPA